MQEVDRRAQPNGISQVGTDGDVGDMSGQARTDVKPQSSHESLPTNSMSPRGPKFNRPVKKGVVWNCAGDQKSRHKSTELDNLEMYTRKYGKLKKRCPNCASSKCKLKSKKCTRKPDEGDLTDTELDVHKKDAESGDEGCKHCNSRAWFCTCKVVDVLGENFPRKVKEEVSKPCPVCTKNIQMTPRLVMVDQLWMWILDERTILTFFPRRYGFNRQDITGIHKKIRHRLGQSRRGQVKSIFDLALVILSECTKTFFDRKRTNDLQPRVLDLFAEAIGRVVS